MQKFLKVTMTATLSLIILSGICFCVVRRSVLKVLKPDDSASLILADKGESALPFSPGEKIIYSVYYGKVKLGRAELVFKGKKELGNVKAYLITFDTHTPYFKDFEQIFADKDSFLPLKVIRKIKKPANFDTNIEEVYDQDNYKIKIVKKGAFLSKKISINKNSSIDNAILISYYYRTLDDYSGVRDVSVNLPTKKFNLNFKGKETVNTGAGKFSAFVFEGDPYPFRLWLRDAPDRVPLKIELPGMMGYSLICKEIINPVRDRPSLDGRRQPEYLISNGVNDREENKNK